QGCWGGPQRKCGRLVLLPLSHIKVIMTSSPEVTSINQDVLVLSVKATELFGSPFVQYVTTYSYRQGSGKEKPPVTYQILQRKTSRTLCSFLAETKHNVPLP
uniref:Uncharacterized protein n=1 Tax=Moschus moschiferus TaxID=68415 RepID=A0A8C6D4J4_MOSMO